MATNQPKPSSLKMAKLNTRTIKRFKRARENSYLQMLTCYDFQTAQLLNQLKLEMILVGDSLGNVILGYDSTIKVTLEEMTIFSTAVKRGAKNKFVIADLPFGSYADFQTGLSNAIKLFQSSGVEALKLEGAFPYQLELITRLTQIGIPVMGHIGLMPQSVHQQGGYYLHGKDLDSETELIKSATALEKAGAFAIVLECIDASVAGKITASIEIPTIGIGSGHDVDGKVLVLNDLLGMGKHTPPKFVSPISNLFAYKSELIEKYLEAESFSATTTNSSLSTTASEQQHELKSPYA